MWGHLVVDFASAAVFFFASRARLLNFATLLIAATWPGCFSGFVAGASEVISLFVVVGGGGTTELVCSVCSACGSII